MKLYFAASEHDVALLHRCGVRRALVAFSAPRKSVIDVLRIMPDVLLDSGAFSAKYSGATIELNDYIGFIRNHGVSSYIALDDIDSHERTAANLARMHNAGLSPLPVFHYGEPFDLLDAMCRDHEYVCVGGAAKKELRNSPPKLRAYLDSCFAVIRDHWPVKVHGLGAQQRWVLERYPFCSVDATTWQNGDRYGTIIDSVTGNQISGVRAMDEATLRRRASANHEFAVWGVAEHADGSKRREHNIRATLAAEAHVTELWQRRGITFND